MTRACPRCNAANAAADTFCGACGASLAAAGPLCAKCARPFEPHEIFCPNCGTGRDGAAPTPRTPTDRVEREWAKVRAALEDATRGSYEIRDPLGRGGMAAVYRAHEVSLGRDVAIKVMSPALLLVPDAIDRFTQEARTMARMKHRNIVAIHAVVESPLHYLVMEYIEGQSLDRILKAVGQLPIPVAQVILFEVATALQHAHNQGIVHRDIKPSNIMIDHDGRTMVMDFGIAKAMEAGTQAGATSGPIGTAEYMSPEQIMMKRITGATDQYSLGIVAYHLLTGQLPFQGTGNQVMMGHVNHAPEPVSKHRPDCPPFIERGILRMIAKDPADRFPSVVEAIRAIGGAGKPDEGPLDESLKAMAAGRGAPALSIPVREPSGAQPTPAPPIGGRRRLRAAVATAAVGTVALIGYLVFRPPPPDPEADKRDGSDTTRIDTTGGPGPGVVIGQDSVPADSTGSRGTGTGGLTRAAVLQVSSSRIALILGDSTRIPVVARDTAGQATPVQITVADPGVAQATWQRGQLVIRGLTAGTTTVRLAANGRTASVPVEVRRAEPQPVEVARLEIRPATATLAVGEGRQLVAESFDQQGRRLDAPLTWSSASDAVTVGPDGTIRARAAGSRIRITATAPGGKTATVLVDVPEPVRDTATTGGGTTSGNSGGAPSAEAEIETRNRALVDLFAKRNTGALMGLYQAETGTDAGWGDRLATMVREDLESAALAGAQTEVQPNGAVSALQISVRYRDPVAGGRRSATLSVLVRYTRLGDQWTIRSFSLTRRPPT